MVAADVYHIKATWTDRYLRIRSNPYRIIAIDHNSSLYDLAEAILKSFHFALDHCFGFYDNLKNIYDSWEGYEYFTDLGEESGFPGVIEATVDTVYKQLKKRMLFYFDYGDDWRFLTQLVKIVTGESYNELPVVIKSVGGYPLQYGE
jgi:hypothetical protein